MTLERSNYVRKPISMLLTDPGRRRTTTAKIERFQKTL